MTPVAATTPRRSAHTDHGAPAVQDVLQIRGLVDPGLTTDMTRALLPGLSGADEILLRAECPAPGTATLLQGLAARKTVAAAAPRMLE